MNMRTRHHALASTKPVCDVIDYYSQYHSNQSGLVVLRPPQLCNNTKQVQQLSSLLREERILLLL